MEKWHPKENMTKDGKRMEILGEQEGEMEIGKYKKNDCKIPKYELLRGTDILGSPSGVSVCTAHTHDSRRFLRAVGRKETMSQLWKRLQLRDIEEAVIFK